MMRAPARLFRAHRDDIGIALILERHTGVFQRSCDRANAAGAGRNDTSRIRSSGRHCHGCRARRYGRPLRSRRRGRRGCGQSPAACRVRPAPASGRPLATNRRRWRRRCVRAIRPAHGGDHQIGAGFVRCRDRQRRCGAAGINLARHGAERRDCGSSKVMAMSEGQASVAAQAAVPGPAPISSRLCGAKPGTTSFTRAKAAAAAAKVAGARASR